MLMLLLTLASACISSNASQRYRGQYTLGHEVNIFCPQINSQCYWLSPDTDNEVRAKLKAIYQEKSPGLYKPVCVTISGVIDRNTDRSGFAADTDGLITITRVFGDCDTVDVVTEGDLQHHRWELIAVNHSAITKADWPVMPVLDFGERLFIEGGDGCRRFTGFAALTAKGIVFDGLEFGANRCEPDEAYEALFSIEGEWEVSIMKSHYLMLENGHLALKFGLNDWR